MHLSAEDWGRQIACLEPDKAVAVFRTQDLTLTWSNQAYLDLLDEPFRTLGARGLALKDYSPLTYATQAQLLRSVAACGTPACSEDRSFSVEDGITLFRWTMHCMDGHVIAVIDSELRVPPLGSVREECVARPALVPCG